VSRCAEQVLAPGYKGRARFKFFAERCPHRRNNFQDFEQQLSPILVGQFGWIFVASLVSGLLQYYGTQFDCIVVNPQRWLGGVTVRASDLRSSGRGFDLQIFH